MWRTSVSLSPSRMTTFFTLPFREKPRHPAEETNLSRLYPWTCSFSHYLRLLTIDESKNVDWQIHFMSVWRIVSACTCYSTCITAATATISLSVSYFSATSFFLHLWTRHQASVLLSSRKIYINEVNLPYIIVLVFRKQIYCCIKLKE